MVRSKSQSVPPNDVQRIEQFNRARDFFGDPVQRRKDQLVLTSSSKIENYIHGRTALVLQCYFPSLCADKSYAPGTAGKVEALPIDGIVFIILKAYIVEFHRLKHWDDKLMFVQVIQVMQGPQVVIPSLVGFYGVQDVFTERFADLLFFESRIQAGYKFLPRIRDWETRPFVSLSDSGGVEQIERTPEIMERIANYKCARITRKFRRVDVEFDEGRSIRVLFNADTIEVGVEKPFENRIQILDVLLGPLNLEP